MRSKLPAESATVAHSRARSTFPRKLASNSPSTFSQRPSMRSLNSTHARSIAPRGMSWFIGFPLS